MCKRINNPAYGGFLHPGANQRYRLAGKIKPVVSAFEGSEGGNVHFVLLYISLRNQQLLKLNNFGKYADRFFQYFLFVCTAGGGYGFVEPFVSFAAHPQ